MRRALVTGVSGYIGAQLAQALLSTHRVYGLVRRPPQELALPAALRGRVELLRYDGSGESAAAALRASRPDVVYHLAAHYTAEHRMEAVPLLVESNLALGAYLLEAMNQSGCRRLVYASSVTTHWSGGGYQPLTLYAATKQAFSDLVEFYTGSGLLRAAAVALSDTYGPGDRRPKVLNLVRQAALEGRTLDLTAGKQMFDAVYIDDVVNGLLRAAAALEESETPHAFFQLASAHPCSLRETVERMLRLHGSEFQAGWGARPDPEGMTKVPVRLYPPPPGWKETVSLEEGLRRLWEGASFEMGGKEFG